MRSNLIGSVVIHVTLLAVLFLLPGSRPVIVPGPEVVQVSLIDPSQATPVPPPTVAPEPDPRPAEIAPTEETGVKLTPPKPPKRKQPEPEPERPTTPPPPSMAGLPSTPVGNAGLKGQISVDAADFEFTYYLLLVRNRIAQNWTPPAGLATGGNPVRSVVYFRIARGGEISGARLESASGADYFDRSSVRAIVISDPLPPLPLGYSGSDLGVHFGFEYAGP